MSNNNPIHRVKLRSVSASVFENQTQKGDTFSVAKIKRSYHDGKEWKQTDSYSFDDLLVLQQVVDLTIDWMRSQMIAEHDKRHTNEPS